MKRISLIVIFMLSIGIVKSQDYEWALGLRAGYGSGFTIKNVISSRASVEGILDFRYAGFNLTALYELNEYDAFGQDRLNWYYGAGAHIGSYGAHKFYNDRQRENIFVLGIDGILGIEYNIQEVPINVSLDWKPTIHLLGFDGFFGDTGALSVRYYF